MSKSSNKLMFNGTLKLYALRDVSNFAKTKGLKIVTCWYIVQGNKRTLYFSIVKHIISGQMKSRPFDEKKKKERERERERERKNVILS
jgi:hypothetical protein